MDSGGWGQLRVVMFAQLARDKTEADVDVDHSASRPGSAENTLFHAPISSNLGTIVDSHGNGVVAVFDSCTNALKACLALSRRLAVDSPTQDLRLRIGLSVGDITFDGQDVFGPAVVEAARLEQQCPPGQILTSEAVLEIATVPSELTVSSRAKPLLKGFATPTSTCLLTLHDFASSKVDLPPQLNAVATYPLVGVASLLGTCREIWDLAKADQGQFLVLTGSQGAGKSRVASELAHQAHAEGATVLYGSCRPELAIPYHPIAMALERVQHLDQALRDGFTHLTGTLASLRLALPVRQSKEIPPLTSDSQPSDQGRLFAEIAAALTRQCEIAPVVLVLDDLHWAEAATIELLTHLINRLGSNRLLIVGTTRHDEADSSGGALSDLLLALQSSDVSTSLAMLPMGADQIASLLTPHESKPSSNVRDLADHIERTTTGNPLFIEEIIAHLIRTQALRRDGSGWTLHSPIQSLTFPDSIIEMAYARVARLGAAVGRVLTVASLSGEVFELEAVAAVAEQSLDETIDHLELAERAGLVREGSTPGQYLFANALIPTAMRQSLRSTRKSRLHQRMAETIEDLWPERVDDLVHHWGQALGPKSQMRTAHFLYLAGQRDAQAFAWPSAITRFRSTIEILDARVLEVGSLDAAILDAATGDRQSDIDRAEAWLCLGLAQRALGDVEYRDSVTTAATIARKAGLGQLLGRAAGAMMRPGYWNTGAGIVDEEIVGLCEDALLVLAPDDPLRVRVLVSLATTLISDEHPTRRWDYLQQAQDLSDSLSDPNLIGLCLVAELFSANAPNQRDRRQLAIDRLGGIARATADPHFGFVVGLFQAVAYLEVGDIDGMRSTLKSIGPILDETQNYWYESLVITLEAALDIVQCVPDMGAVVDANLTKFIDTPHDSEGVWTVQHGLIAYQAGTLGELLAPLSSQLENAGELPWATGLALGQLQGGHVAAAAKIIDYDRDFDEYWLAAMHAKATIAFRVNDPSFCQDLYDTLLPYRGRVAFVSRGSTIAGPVSTSLGQAAYVMGDLAKAQELLREGMAQAKFMKAHFFTTEALYCLALTLFREDTSSQEARQLATQAAQLSDKYGFGWHSKQADDLLRSMESTISA